jgi:hypothetical protein
VRYSLLHAVIDRADAGVRLARGAHTLEPSIEYFYPTFDGDSIFNVFSIEPTTDLRLAYQRTGALGLRVTGWLRAYHPDAGDADAMADPDDPDDLAGASAARAGGVDAGVEHVINARWRARVDALWDDGYGGRRIGGSAEAGWRPERNLWLRGRLITLAVARDDGGTGSSARPRYVTSSAVVSSTWQVTDGVALHAIVELDDGASHDLRYRAIGMFDFAFAPEP